MKRWTPVTGMYFTLYLAGILGQTIFNSKNFYKPMTNDYDVRHRGQVFLPPCVKNLLNCWELVRPDLFCKYYREHRLALESICMDMRLQCTEYTGPLPFETVNVSNWDYCPANTAQLSSLDLRPNTPAEEKYWYSWIMDMFG